MPPGEREIAQDRHLDLGQTLLEETQEPGHGLGYVVPPALYIRAPIDHPDNALPAVVADLGEGAQGEDAASPSPRRSYRKFHRLPSAAPGRARRTMRRYPARRPKLGRAPGPAAPFGSRRRRPSGEAGPREERRGSGSWPGEAANDDCPHSFRTSFRRLTRREPRSPEIGLPAFIEARIMPQGLPKGRRGPPDMADLFVSREPESPPRDGPSPRLNRGVVAFWPKP